MVFLSVFNGTCRSIALTMDFWLVHARFFLMFAPSIAEALYVKAAIRTCLVAWSFPRLFTLRIFVKLISVTRTGQFPGSKGSTRKLPAYFLFHIGTTLATFSSDL